MSLAIDHVIYATADLDAAAARFEEVYGLRSVKGGNHVEFGTGNRIVPLRNAYIELMGITDKERAASNALGQFIEALTEDGDRFFAFVVRTDELESHARRLGLEIMPGARQKPDGSTISWRLAGLDRAMDDPSLPFFIQWSPGVQHPGTDPIEHPAKARAISWIEVGALEPRLRAWVHHEPLPVRISDGEAGVRAVGVETPDGELVLRS
ncbi:MAG TPA: VOC family protein [Actinomycetota bacterium]|nr:VOC family protein [Actinomycetota bacterium]